MQVIKSFTHEYSIKEALKKMLEYPISERPLLGVEYKAAYGLSYYSHNRGFVADLLGNLVIFRGERVIDGTFSTYIDRIRILKVLGE